MTIFWTEERIASLRKLATKNLSSAAMAKILGCGRNAVIGKLYRMGIVNVRRYKIDTKSAVQKADTTAKKTGNPFYPRNTQVTEATEIDVKDEQPYTGSGISLHELTNSTCRWPHNTSVRGVFCFCGVLEANMAEERPYCREHTALAHRKAP